MQLVILENVFDFKFDFNIKEYDQIYILYFKKAPMIN